MKLPASLQACVSLEGRAFSFISMPLHCHHGGRLKGGHGDWQPFGEALGPTNLDALVNISFLSSRPDKGNPHWLDVGYPTYLRTYLEPFQQLALQVNASSIALMWICHGLVYPKFTLVLP